MIYLCGKRGSSSPGIAATPFAPAAAAIMSAACNVVARELE
jgi:hypothetical protein